MSDADKLALLRSIMGQAEMEAGRNLSPGATAAIAWRTIGQIKKLIGPDNDENRTSNLVMLRATYNDLLSLQDQTDTIPLVRALDAVGLALEDMDGQGQYHHVGEVITPATLTMRIGTRSLTLDPLLPRPRFNAIKTEIEETIIELDTANGALA